jgi:hypothetical protein
VIRTKEMELDREVLYYSRLRTQGHPWLLWPESEGIDVTRHLRSIGKYRAEFPAVLPTLGVPGSDDVSAEMRRGNAEVARTTAEIVQSYGR